MAPATAGRSADLLRQQLRDLLAPVVAGIGYDLEDVGVTSAGRRSLIRVVVDRDGGIDLDAVAEISRAVSDALDSDTPGGRDFAAPFVLEVSSPGVDRPLTEQRHWRRAVGRLVQTTAGQQPVTGRVLAVSEAAVSLDVTGAVRELAWGELGPGKVQVEFARPDDTGGAHHSAEED